jgi:hypothetical protein
MNIDKIIEIPKKNIDKLYILNDISKIHENKYFVLPKSINILLNDQI